ncbi:MAG: hypothetical protein RIR91_2074 [Verrucomicrobiota bacterium]
MRDVVVGLGVGGDVVEVGVTARGEDGPEVGHAVHVAGHGGAAGTMGGQGRVVGGGQDMDLDLGEEVAEAFGEVGRRVRARAIADDAGQGLDIGRVARADLHARELGLAREVGGDGGLHDVADGFGAH